MRDFLTGGIAVVLCSVIAVPAEAQTAPAERSSSLKDITCRDFLRLGQPEADQALYFVNGYSSGAEDQVAANTSGPASGSGDRSGTATPGSGGWISLDDLQAICQASPSSTVLSMVPHGGTGAISNNAAGGQAQGNGRPATSGGGNTGAAAIGRSNTTTGAGASSAPSRGAVTTPGTTVTNPSTGITTGVPGSTTMSSPITGATPTSPAAPSAPIAGQGPGGTSAPAGGASSGAAGGT
jgi:hypothetical protein